MRTFEVALIVGNALAALLSFRKLPKMAWLGVAGINLLALIFHAVFEAFRWQMAFSYLFVPLLSAYALANASGRSRRSHVPLPLKAIAASLSIVLIALTAFLFHAFPVFTLPKPTGEYAVGVQYLALTDENRADPFLDKSPQKRRLMLKVYYPATPDDAKPFAPYFNGSARLLRAWAGFYGMPAFLFDHLRLVKTYAKGDLPVSDALPRYPLILFSHGAGTTMEAATSQCEDLASHGYIVAAIDHPYVSAATDFPDRTVTAQEATTNFNTPEPADPITQIMADDIRFVIKTLGGKNKSRPDAAFRGKINVDKIGVIGHSVGGAAAYNLALSDRRVKAAVNLDGAVYVTPKGSRPVAPFLMLANDKFHVGAITNRQSLMKRLDATPEGEREMRDVYGGRAAYEAAYKKAQENSVGLANLLKASDALYAIAGSDHMKFTDIGLFLGARWLRELLQIGGSTDPARCLIITQALTVAFFDQHLKGRASEALPALVKIYPELRKVTLH
jgi:predicted dienelactone hydrolase